MNDSLPPSPLFDQLAATLRSEGPASAIDRLCAQLRRDREYNGLFYALLLKKRHELGANPIPTGTAEELPEGIHATYEEGIKAAAREIGELYLQAGQLPQAWVFFRMIGEPGPIREALERYQPQDDEDIQPLVQIAFYEGVHPHKGFDWLLSRYGLCSAITTVGGELPHPMEVKRYCVQALIRALYHDLRERLTAEIQGRWGTPPAGADAPPDTPGVIRQLITDRDYLFGEDAYYVDTSHLSSVVQMALHLEPCKELGMARELCAYGAKLQGRFLGQEEAPFEDGYSDYDMYLSALTGENVEGAVAHFRAKVDNSDPEEVGTYPAEVLVNLLLKLNRGQEAIDVSRQYLARAEQQGRQLTCPNLNELCQKMKAYGTLAEVARELNDPVFYLAGLLAAAQHQKPK